MGKSFEAQIRDYNGGNHKEVAQFARVWGLEAAAKEYGAKETITIENYLAKFYPKENFRHSIPEADDVSNPDFAYKLLQGFLRSYNEMRDYAQSVVVENQQLKARLDKEGKARWQRTRPILTTLMTEISKDKIDF